MVKLKQPEDNSSDHATDLNLLEEDWVIVKRQRVNILMPPSQVSFDPVPCNPPSHQIQEAVSREIDSSALERPAGKFSEARFAHGNDKPSSQTMEDIPFSSRSCNPSNGIVPEMRDVPKTQKSTRDHRELRSGKQWALLYSRESKVNDGSILLSKMMKASNLERKLIRAGGLSRWLTSLGLEEFIRIFQARNISKFQLINLTMKKLEHMGIQAVGPRRKLIHAIECVCHPYCFQVL